MPRPTIAGLTARVSDQHLELARRMDRITALVTERDNLKEVVVSAEDELSVHRRARQLAREAIDQHFEVVMDTELDPADSYLAEPPNSPTIRFLRRLYRQLQY